MIHCAAMVFGSYCVWLIEATKSRLKSHQVFGT